MLAQVIVTTDSDIVDAITVNGISALPGPDGVTSLREAIQAANATTGADEIVFDFDEAQTIALTQGQITIDRELQINGTGIDNLTITVAGGEMATGRIFNIDSSASDVAIRDLAITGGRTTNGGGGILAQANLKLERVRMEDNSGTSYLPIR